MKIPNLIGYHTSTEGRITYQTIVSSIPAKPGILIITGHYKHSQITLEVLKSEESIRSAFSRPQNNNRFQTLLNYFKDQLFDHIEIQLAKASWISFQKNKKSE